jgi:hypothetical protein
LKIGTQVETLKQTIVDLKAAVQTAKDKQKAASQECKKLERDMDEFKNNKEGKIDELKVGFMLCLIVNCRLMGSGILKRDISKQKAALQRHAVIVKTQQKELQTATLELGTYCLPCCSRVRSDVDISGT